MSTSVPTDPNELRPLLHERLEQWAAADLPLLHHPERIVLFGSYAYGRPTADSDVDVLVVLPHRKGTRPSLKIRQRVRASFPVDILVRAPEEIARRLRERDSFITEVMTKGRLLYEARHS